MGYALRMDANVSRIGQEKIAVNTKENVLVSL